MPNQFEWQAPPSLENGSIGQLMLAGPRALSQAARDAAAARAQAVASSGQIKGQAFSNIGQQIAAIPGQIRQHKAQDQQAAMNAQTMNANALAIEGAERSKSTADALEQAISLPENQTDGQPDDEKIVNWLKGKNVPAWQQYQAVAQANRMNDLNVKEKVLSIKNGEQAIEDKQRALKSLQQTELGRRAYNALSVIDSKADDPLHARDSFNAAVVAMQKDQIITPEQAQRALWKTAQAGPDQLRQVLASMVPPELKASLDKNAADLAKTQADTSKVEAEVAGTLPLNPAQRETERHNKEMERIQTLTVGRQELANAETARHNRAMEENARNAKVGRPVISGDANKIADFNTSLNDLKTLRRVIAPKDTLGNLKEDGNTGTIAKIGTVLPNWVTNAIGWNGPKQKQGTIDRVKQVIGKTLEGGVLRKEDEVKYEKILPTIYDDASVVDTKLKGLDAAIRQRLGVQLDSLEDAGYNVSRYRERGPSTEPDLSATEAPKPTALTPGLRNLKDRP